MFDAGDVITLLAALVVVVVLRQLDRSNRSLEKVKRYGDRVMRSLSTFVEKKNSEIKDLSIEVQVSVKQGKELLRSVRDVQDDLAARRRDLEERSAEIDAISTRIDGYDAALAELVNMSERVDENLRRLRGEDERLRRVDDQRTALQERLTGLDAKAASIDERLDDRLQVTAIEGRLADVEDAARQAVAGRLADFERRFATDLEERAAGMEARQASWQAETDRRVDTLRQETAARAEEAAGELARTLRERAGELQRRSAAEIDGVRATVDRFESETAERCAALDAELTGIAARLTVFTDQTPLLERADRMQQHLESLSARLADLQGQKREVAEMEMELNRTRKLGEELSDKLARFQAERHRVEAIERDFRKLAAIAEEMDARLTGMETTRQAVHDLQAKFRQLDELADAADERYRQLEEKREAAEATASGVDRNFELLSQLDEQVIGLRPDVLKLTAGMAEMQRQVDALAGNKESADAVVRSLDGIDELLAELDGRTARLTAARDWLARAETRLERIGQQAHASVSELEALTAARSADNGGGAGAGPAVDDRRTVSKLAGQGWSVPEIARATKLSHSEVELILEAEPAAGVLPASR